MAAQDVAPVVPGYRISTLIARGSSSTVWAATRAPSPGALPDDGVLPDDGDLAIKVMPVAHADDEERLAFELAALAAGCHDRRRSEHLIEVLDVVAVTQPGPGVAIVMERLLHGTLARLVATRGHLTPGEVVTVLTPVALAIAELHDAAVVHGDLSAGNVGFDSRGRPVVLDLGVCTVIGTSREHVYGTPGFIAPEVVAGGPATPPADVYAMGALGWHALAGEPPAIPADRPPLRDLVPDLPDALVDAIELALDPDPAARGTARDLATAVYAATPAAAIKPVAGDDPALMLTRRVRELARSGDPEAVTTRRARHTALRSRARAVRLRVVTMLIAAFVLGAVGVWAVPLGRGANPAPVAPATASAQPSAIAAPAPVDYVVILQELVDARAHAWTTGDPALLRSTFRPDSAVLSRDEELIGKARTGGHRYVGLEFAVVGTEVLRESDSQVWIRTTLETSGYVVRTGTSSVDRPPATARVLLTLVRSDDQWLIEEIAPADG